MKITRRIEMGWSKTVENESKTHCDLDGAKLWIAPHGGKYCERTHDKDVADLELSPVHTSGTFFCEEDDCTAEQRDEDDIDRLFYGKDNGMYCNKHVIQHL